MKRSLPHRSFLALAAAFLITAGSTGQTPESAPAPRPAGAPGMRDELGSQAHLDWVMTSASCAGCHPAIWAENAQNTHGLAFFDVEARAATRGFRRDDCVRCHTPRPVFETGIGLTPMQRWTHLEEGNDCMSCHWKAEYDYSRFAGGAECKTAFDPRVGTVQACASCHRIGGTPDQWSRAEHGKLAGRVCVDCHMPLVERPVAVGEPARPVRSHVFPASRSESQLRRACDYQASIQGNEVVVRIANRGAGHNFPTASRQRAVESLVTVRDENGAIIGTSRLVCRYPYAAELQPGQLTMPLSTQIPSGKSREQRVPLPVARGTVTCELFFKRYRPIGDYNPLSRRLYDVRLPFADVAPSTEAIKDAPDVGFPAPPASLEDFFDPKGFSNVARPGGTGPIVIPEGKDKAELARLVSLLEFHMPEARAEARERLAKIGPAALPALISALGDWSNETFNQAMEILVAIGEPAVPALREALQSPQLYVRCHARATLARMGFPGDRAGIAKDLRAGLASPAPLDRRSTAEALGVLGDAADAPALRALLSDRDCDVIIAAAAALARLDDKDAVPLLRAALARATYVESRRDLALALCELGDPSGASVLLDGLSQDDDLTRTSFFEAFFAVTGMHAGYDPALPHADRLESLARLRAAWEQRGGPKALRRRFIPDPDRAARAARLVAKLGGGSDVDEGGNDGEMMDELLAMGRDAIPALIEGLTYPTGWAVKRERVCETLGRLRARDAVPALVAALRDPYVGVADWACLALESARDPDVLPALQRFEARVVSLQSDPKLLLDSEWLLARVSRTRLMLGDENARKQLVSLLLSESQPARELAIGTLSDRYGDRRGYDAGAPAAARIEAAKRWLE